MAVWTWGRGAPPTTSATRTTTTKKTAAKAKRTRARPRVTWRQRLLQLEAVAAPGLCLLCASISIALGLASLLSTRAEDFPLAVLAALSVSLGLLMAHSFRRSQRLDPALVALLGLCAIGATFVAAPPVYFTLPGIHAIFHRSIISTAVLILVGVPSAACALYRLFGSSPRAEDLAWYPIVLAPMVAALAVYGALILNIFARAFMELRPAGKPFSLQVFTRAYENHGTDLSGYQSGFVHLLEGTALLIALTLAISAPIGIGVGVFISEFGRGKFGSLVRWSVTALRGISVLVLALAAASLVAITRSSPIAEFVAGSHLDFRGNLANGHGSFVLAACILSLLVIPVIARATEQGCQSLPRLMREGSAALGASEDYTLLRITLPWAIPNIITSLLIGCAEAAGSVGAILFIAGTGEFGAGPFSEVTSLAFAIYFAQYAPTKPFRDAFLPYQFTAGATLLVIVLGFTVVALILKVRYAERYRGA